MRRHLSMRTGNPALNKNTFKGLSTTDNQLMTIDGTVNKTSIALVILILSAYYTFSTALLCNTALRNTSVYSSSFR